MSESRSQPWTVEPLGRVATITVGGTPSTDVSEFWGGVIPWMASGDIHRSRIRDVGGRITDKGLQCSNAKVVPAGAVAIALAGQGKTRGTVALTAIDLCTNQSVALVSTDRSKLLPEFLFQSLIPRYDELRSSSSGGGRGGLTKRILELFPVAYPAPDKQRRIADMLLAADENISQAEAQVEKERLRFAGLQQLLLSCSRLRDSEIDNVLLHQLVPVVQYGISTSLETQGVVPVLRMNNLFAGEVDVSDVKYSPLMVSSDLVLRDGDVLFNRTNSMEHVGRTSIWRSQLPVATFASYLVRLHPDETRITKPYLVYLLSWAENQTQMRRYATPGVQQVNINPTSLRRCRVRVPRSLDIQRETVFMLDASRAQIASLVAEVEKFRLQKQGLALELLTGKVPVPA